GCLNSRNSGASSTVFSAPTAASQRPSAQRPCTPASSYAWRTLQGMHLECVSGDLPSPYSSLRRTSRVYRLSAKLEQSKPDPGLSPANGNRHRFFSACPTATSCREVDGRGSPLPFSGGRRRFRWVYFGYGCT